MVGGLRCIVIHVKCDPNRLRGYYGAVGSKMALPHYFDQWLIQQLVLPYVQAVIDRYVMLSLCVVCLQTIRHIQIQFSSVLS